MQHYRQRINKCLDAILPLTNEEPQQLHRAMRYAVLNGGKRIRPLIVYAIGTMYNAEVKLLDLAASAIELVHSYSLIHDDLPAMDNDAMRRGKPSCHIAFDEATAILAGDTLFNLAYLILAEAKQIEMIKILTHASGSKGMAGGQMIDLSDQELTLGQLENMHLMKTGALIRASIQLGTTAAGLQDKQQLELLDNYGKNIGLAFQIQDDILDAAEINDNKTTYVSLLGKKEAQLKLSQLEQQISQNLNELNADTTLLRQLTNKIIKINPDA